MTKSSLNITKPVSVYCCGTILRKKSVYISKMNVNGTYNTNSCLWYSLHLFERESHKVINDTCC